METEIYFQVVYFTTSYWSIFLPDENEHTTDSG